MSAASVSHGQACQAVLDCAFALVDANRDVARAMGRYVAHGDRLEAVTVACEFLAGAQLDLARARRALHLTRNPEEAS